MKNLITTILCLLLSQSVLFAAPPKEVPAKLQVAIFYKILGFNKNISNNVSIHVMGDDDVAEHFKQIVGKDIGNGKITAVTSGLELPPNKPTIIYIGNVRDRAAILAYCQKNGVMSIAGNRHSIVAGASLGLVVKNGKPQILVGLAGTKNEKIKWQAVIFKLAQTVK